jgi:hypothetical protein
MNLQSKLHDWMAMWEKAREAGVNAPRNINDWLYENGAAMDQRAVLPERQVFPKSRQCYYNAWMHKVRHEPEATYCEGYCWIEGVIIPVMHGWLLSTDGKVIDPSVEQDVDAAYYGVQFRDEFARPIWKRLLKMQAIGIIENLWQLRFHPDELVDAVQRAERREAA